VPGPVGKLDLLILEELGYVPASKAGAELLFDVIATAYERNSLVVRTNLPFENWTEVLGSERLTGAALDRVTHRCLICVNRQAATPDQALQEEDHVSFTQVKIEGAVAA
jgi:DNA replication protein DnaC